MGTKPMSEARLAPGCSVVQGCPHTGSERYDDKGVWEPQPPKIWTLQLTII